MALDLTSLWDFSDPAASERRFRDALDDAQGDDALILHTQIARAHGLRKDFAAARALLEAMAPEVASAGPEARIRHALETGRTWASAAHPPESVAPEDRERARTCFEDAWEWARAAGRDALAIDAIHMLAFVDPEPEDQLRWGREALAVVEGSTQPDARRWEASVRNNVGYALRQLGRDHEALAQFEAALALRLAGTNAAATRAARWMVAWTLRALGRSDEALAMQEALEAECAAAGEPDIYVFEELEILHRERGDTERAQRYARLRAVS